MYVATDINGLKDRGFTLKLAGQNGARGRIRTCAGDALDVVSLLLDYASKSSGASSRWLPRQDFITKEIRRLLHGGENGRSPRCCPGRSERMRFA